MKIILEHLTVPGLPICTQAHNLQSLDNGRDYYFFIENSCSYTDAYESCSKILLPHKLFSNL